MEPSEHLPPPVSRFYDELADSYHFLYPDWPAQVTRQGGALDARIRAALGEGPHPVLDCACGIGTQAIGLAAAGQRVTGTDLSGGALARAAREAAMRDLPLRLAAADMRQLPFPDGTFAAVVCADNSLAHLLTPQDAGSALASMRRVLRPGGLLLLGVRAYEVRRPATLPQIARTPDGSRVITFQLWEWHEDGETYDFEHFQLLPQGDGWRVAVRRARSRARSREQVTGLVTAAGFTHARWHEPDADGYFQPLLTARA